MQISSRHHPPPPDRHDQRPFEWFVPEFNTPAVRLSKPITAYHPAFVFLPMNSRLSVSRSFCPFQPSPSLTLWFFLLVFPSALASQDLFPPSLTTHHRCPYWQSFFVPPATSKCTPPSFSSGIDHIFRPVPFFRCSPFFFTIRHFHRIDCLVHCPSPDTPFFEVPRWV